MQTQLRWRLQTPLPTPIHHQGVHSPGLKRLEETWSAQISEHKALPSVLQSKA